MCGRYFPDEAYHSGEQPLWWMRARFNLGDHVRHAFDQFLDLIFGEPALKNGNIDVGHGCLPGLGWPDVNGGESLRPAGDLVFGGWRGA